MFAEIITIGDELLIGQVVDTNSAWIGQKLNKIGIEVLRIVSIRDREDEILEAIDNAMKRVNIVLVTGGLGPTKDDITKQTLCKYFHTRLVFSEEVFENIKRVLAGKIPMNALNKGQATVLFAASISSLASLSSIVFSPLLREYNVNQRSARACLLSALTSIGTWYVAPPIRLAFTSSTGIMLFIASSNTSIAGLSDFSAILSNAPYTIF